MGTLAGVHVSVMLPLDLVNQQNMQINNVQKLTNNLKALKQINVDSVNVDVWWGLVEANGPKQYNWAPYQQLVQLCRQVGLKLQVVMSFHECGGNVGDTCNIPLPSWARSVGPSAFYTDREGNVDYEYISLGADNAAIFGGRSPIQIYTDYMTNFRDSVLANSVDVITKVFISMGPAGELRYPSYRFNAYPGVGEFQSYDPYMLANLKQAAAAVGHPEWGNGGPSNAGTYQQQPSQTGFWSEGTFDNYASPNGQFFLGWYSNMLIAHGTRVLSAANRVFGTYMKRGVQLGAKVSGIHWLYKSLSHAAECTVGYYNTNSNNGYTKIAQLVAAANATYDFTCFEMLDSDQCNTCGPQELVQQNHLAANAAGCPFFGENALQVYDQRHYNEILYQSSNPTLVLGFAYLRLSDTLMNGGNLQVFGNFVNQMHNL